MNATHLDEMRHAIGISPDQNQSDQARSLVLRTTPYYIVSVWEWAGCADNGGFTMPKPVHTKLHGVDEAHAILRSHAEATPHPPTHTHTHTHVQHNYTHYGKQVGEGVHDATGYQHRIEWASLV
jgi:hypothetical protein